jgi:hypothetical protein
MNFKRSLIILAIAATLLSGMTAMGLGGDSTIEGTWETTVSLNDPNLPPSFLALETYNRDGGLITSNNMPFLTKVGQGSWEKNGQGQISVRIKFYMFDSNGLPTGTINVTHAISLESKDEYSGVGTAQFCENDGVTCQSAGFTTEGRRLN